MADLKKFLDKQGVSTLWSKIAEKVATDIAEEASARVTAIEDVNSTIEQIQLAVADNTSDIASLDTKVGTLPEGNDNVIAYVNKKAEETLAAASGNSTETAASVKQQLDNYKTENDAAVATKADKTDLKELTNRVVTNENAIEVLNGNADVEGSVDAKVAAAVAALMENPDETLNSIKELVKWTQNHAEDAIEMSNNITANTNAIDALEALVGEENVADQIATAIANALNLDGAAKYALAADLTAAITRIDTIEGDYLKASDKTELSNAIALKADTTALGEVKATADAAAVKTDVDNAMALKAAQADLEAEEARAKAAEKVNADAIAAITALTTEDIDAAIAEASV